MRANIRPAELQAQVEVFCIQKKTFVKSPKAPEQRASHETHAPCKVAISPGRQRHDLGSSTVQVRQPNPPSSPWGPLASSGCHGTTRRVLLQMPDETVQAPEAAHVWIEEQEILGIHLGKHPVVPDPKRHCSDAVSPNGFPKRRKLGKSVVVARVVENDDLNGSRGGFDSFGGTGQSPD